MTCLAQRSKEQVLKQKSSTEQNGTPGAGSTKNAKKEHGAEKKSKKEHEQEKNPGVDLKEQGVEKKRARKKVKREQKVKEGTNQERTQEHRPI